MLSEHAGLHEQFKYYDTIKRRLMGKPSAGIEAKPLPEPFPPLRITYTFAFGDPTGSLKSIIREVAWDHDLSVATIKSEARLRRVVAARNEFYYRAIVETDQSLAGLGRFTGHDHSTVIHGIKTHCRRHGLELPRGMMWGKRFAECP